RGSGRLAQALGPPVRARKVLGFTLASTLALVIALPFLHVGLRAQRLCEWFGGSWASTSFSCITRSCYEAHNCGSRYSPQSYCKNVAPGTPLADAYVLLGEPNWVKGSQLVWHYGSADSGFIVATAEGERVASINCFVAERP